MKIHYKKHNLILWSILFSSLFVLYLYNFLESEKTFLKITSVIWLGVWGYFLYKEVLKFKTGYVQINKEHLSIYTTKTKEYIPLNTITDIRKKLDMVSIFYAGKRTEINTAKIENKDLDKFEQFISAHIVN